MAWLPKAPERPRDEILKLRGRRRTELLFQRQDFAEEVLKDLADGHPFKSIVDRHRCTHDFFRELLIEDVGISRLELAQVTGRVAQLEIDRKLLGRPKNSSVATSLFRLKESGNLFDRQEG